MCGGAIGILEMRSPPADLPDIDKQMARVLAYAIYMEVQEVELEVFVQHPPTSVY